MLAAMAMAAVLAAGTRVSAEGPRGEKEGFSVERKVEKLTQELQLTPEQQAQVKSLLERKQAARLEARAERKGRKDRDDGSIESVLTDAQKAKYREMKEMRRHKMKSHGGKDSRRKERD
jgi:Spy/CpxP family protein refolding chaperone